MIQVKLPIQLPYISPSTYNVMIRCEYEAWIRKCSGIPYMSTDESKSMAVGTSFDAYVKAEIAYLLGKVKESKNLLSSLLSGINEKNLDCIPIGKKLFDRYSYEGCIRRLMDDGLTDIELSSKKEILGTKVKGIEKTIGSVPVFCKPDAVIRTAVHLSQYGTTFSDKERVLPVDWKVNGALSKTGQSPKPGYLRKIVNGFDEGRHDRYGIPLEEIDQDWANQLTFYSWINGNEEIEDYPVAIEQIAVRGETIAFASFRTYVSKAWVQKTKTTLQDLWERFASGTLNEPVPSKFLCEPYNQPKPCTIVCPFYKNTLGNQASRLNNLC